MTVTITIRISDAGGIGEVSVGGGGGSAAITSPGEAGGGGPSSMLLGGPEGAMGGQGAEGSAEGPPPLALEQLGLGSSFATAGDAEGVPPEDFEVMAEADPSEALDEPMPMEDLEQEAKPARTSRKKP